MRKVIVPATQQMTRTASVHTRNYTISAGYLDKSSVNNTQKHPQVVQKDIHDVVMSHNKRAGLSHAAKLNPTHEKKLPTVIMQYRVGLAVDQKKDQYCYHFDASYSAEELSKYKEDPKLTQYLNGDPQIQQNLRSGLAQARAKEHQQEMEKLHEVSDKVFEEVEKNLTKKP